MLVFHSPRYLTFGSGNAEYYARDRYKYRGEGIGSIFSALFSTVVPLVRGALRLGAKVMRGPTGKQVKRIAKRNAVRAGGYPKKLLYLLNHSSLFFPYLLVHS